MVIPENSVAPTLLKVRVGFPKPVDGSVRRASDPFSTTMVLKHDDIVGTFSTRDEHPSQPLQPDF